jgi:hypothetical protein
MDDSAEIVLAARTEACDLMLSTSNATSLPLPRVVLPPVVSIAYAADMLQKGSARNMG